MQSDELIAYLFGGKAHLLAEDIAAWLADSRRFSAFVNIFRDKIRKKLYTAQDQESLLDIRLELETAYLLLRERSLNVVYEPPLPERPRCPDFAITFTTSVTFMLEVTRMQINEASNRLEDRLADTICSKLGQLLPQRSNVLLVGMGTLNLTNQDLRAVMLGIQQKVEGNDPAFLKRYQFRDRAHFFQHYLRLSEVLVRHSDLQKSEAPLIWVNPQAKHSLPAKVRTALYRSQSA